MRQKKVLPTRNLLNQAAHRSLSAYYAEKASRDVLLTLGYISRDVRKKIKRYKNK